MPESGTRRVELLLPIRTVLIVGRRGGVLAAFRAIGDVFLVVFLGIFLALVFEYPVRFLMAKTHLSRGLAATLTVLGTALAVLVLALLLLVPLVGSVRDFLQDLPAHVAQLQDVGRAVVARRPARRERPGGRQQVSASMPDAISAVLGIAGRFFAVFLACFTILFICIFLLTDIER